MAITNLELAALYSASKEIDRRINVRELPYAVQVKSGSSMEVPDHRFHGIDVQEHSGDEGRCDGC